MDVPGITTRSVGLIIHRRRLGTVGRLRDMVVLHPDTVVLRPDMAVHLRGRVAPRRDVAARLRNMRVLHPEEAILRRSMLPSLRDAVARHLDLPLLHKSTAVLRNSMVVHHLKRTERPRSSMVADSQSTVEAVAATRTMNSTTRGNGGQWGRRSVVVK